MRQLFTQLIGAMWLVSFVLNDRLESTLEPAAPEPKFGVIIPAIVTTAILLLTILPVAYELFLGYFGQTGPEQQFLYILGTEDNCKYEHDITFIVGCPSKGFDLKNGFIDFEILVGEDYHMLGTPIRFDCSKMDNSVCSEMCLHIGTVTKLKKFKSIRASHNQGFEVIFFYDYILTNKKGKVIDMREINQFITNQPKDFIGKRLPDASHHSSGMFPPVPLTWSCKELMIFASLGMMINSVIIIVLEYFDVYCFDVDQDGSLFRSLEDVAVSTVLSTAIVALLSIFYMSYCKRKSIEQEYSVFNGKQGIIFSSKVLLDICICSTLIAAVPVVIIGHRISFTKSLYWSAGWLISSVNLFGLMSVGSALASLLSVETVHDDIGYDKLENMKTIYFEAVKQGPKGKEHGKLVSSVVGPKLVNPFKLSSLRKDKNSGQMKRTINQSQKKNQMKIKNKAMP